MRRKFKVRLTRRAGKRLVSTNVLVYQVTLGGFQEALRVAGEYVLRFRDQVKKGAALTERDNWLALSHPDVCAGVADVLCPDQPRDWYRPWHSHDNHFRMLDAARKTSDWSRLIAQLDFTGEKRKGRGKGGSLYGDAILLGRVLMVNPIEIIDVWPMERFLDTCEALIRNQEAAQEAEFLDDPTMDPEAKPSPLFNVPRDRGKVWIN